MTLIAFNKRDYRYIFFKKNLAIAAFYKHSYKM